MRALDVDHYIVCCRKQFSLKFFAEPRSSQMSIAGSTSTVRPGWCHTGNSEVALSVSHQDNRMVPHSIEVQDKMICRLVLYLHQDQHRGTKHLGSWNEI